MNNIVAHVSRLSLLLCGMVIFTHAFAEEAAPASKPITTEAVPEKIKSMESGESLPKPKSKSSAKSTANAAAAEKSEMSADELAEKIAKKMAELRLQNERKKELAARRPEPKPAPTPRPAPKKVRNTELDADTIGAARHTRWDYSGAGEPQRWGKIDPANILCDTGDRQSPINITDGIKVDLEPVLVDYKPTGFNVIDTGNTIQVNVGPGNTISLLGRRYELTQINFHKPSEERVDGVNYDMSAHLVHKDLDGKLVVIAVLIKQGKPNGLIQTVWNNMPLEKNTVVQPQTAIDINDILPAGRKYFTYMGSLTIPPCTEGVQWIVFKEPIELAPEQIAIFSRMYPMNARPIQRSAGRLIKESS